MALCTVQFVGKSLHKSTAMNVIVPEAAEQRPPFPVLYLLHGLSHDYGSWLRNTNLYWQASTLPLIVVMPEGHRNFYCNDPRPDGLPYEDHIVEDVIGFVERTFPVIAKRSARAIAGMSMGGYGAMMLALRHPELFSVASPQAPAIFFAHHIKRPAPSGVQGFAAALPKGKYDCFALAKRFAKSPKRLAIRIGCGKDDGLLDANREFHAHLEKLGIRHEFVITAGGHNSEHLSANLPAILQFVMRHLKQ